MNADATKLALLPDGGGMEFTGIIGVPAGFAQGEWHFVQELSDSDLIGPVPLSDLSRCPIRENAMYRCLAGLFAISFSALSTPALVPAMDGDEKDFWDTHAVIVAAVTEITPSTAERPLDGASVTVLAVAATDTLVPTQLTLTYRLGTESPLRSLHKGETVALVIERTKRGWVIPAMIPEFVPSRSCIVSVDGLDDPSLETICEKIRATRRKYVVRQAEAIRRETSRGQRRGKGQE